MTRVRWWGAGVPIAKHLIQVIDADKAIATWVGGGVARWDGLIPVAKDGHQVVNADEAVAVEVAVKSGDE